MAHSMHWAAVGALLLATLGFAALGRWQLERAELNRATSALFDDAAALPPLEQAVAGAEPFRYRAMRLRGRWEPDSQVLLDNMTSHGAAGYQVLTPFRADDGSLVLVNRGWVPASPDRRVLPELAIARAGDLVVTGRVDRLPRAALDLGGSEPIGRGGPVTVLSFPDFAAIEAVLGVRVRHFQLLLDPGAPDGFVREWTPDTGRADRNIAYAVQWFGLALLALVLAVGIAFRAWRGAKGNAR